MLEAMQIIIDALASRYVGDPEYHLCTTWGSKKWKKKGDDPKCWGAEDSLLPFAVEKYALEYKIW